MRMRPASLTAAAPPSSCHETHSVRAIDTQGQQQERRADQSELGAETRVSRMAHAGNLPGARLPWLTDIKG